MPKSNYPNKLDTSVEIPTIRDNITEIGSDVLNSLRDAIFNIEKTLGINPQGVAGNTLASRLSNIIDENGNLKDEALSKAGILSGPISDKDVSKTAAIKEFKLDLDYPTTLLQDEISILNSKIQEFILALNELNSIVSAHVNENAINRHKAKAITVEGSAITSSDIALNSLETQGLQAFIQSIFDSHISYSGANVTESNNSHSANQIYFDNSENSDLIFSNSVQGAIDDLAKIEGKGLRDSILNLNSNGRIRTGSQKDALEGNDSGSLVTSFSEIAFTQYSGISKAEISFTSSPSLNLDIENFDILEISQSPNELDNKDYIISSYDLNTDGTLNSVTVLEGPLGEFTAGTLGRIKKNTYKTYNQNGLNCSVRPRAGFSNTPSVQVCLPNSATLISSNADFSKLESGVYEKLSIEIDGGTAIEIPVYDSSYESHNIDIVVSIINRYCVQNNLNIFAYKLKLNRCYEIAISHNIPNHSSDIKARSLKVVESSSLDAYSILGFSNIINKEIRGSYGNSFHINGIIASEFGLVKAYAGTSISINSGTNILQSSELDFLALGIRVGDLCVIEGSTDASDNGTYSIKGVTSEYIELDYTTSVFAGSSTEGSLFTFLRSTVPISELNFVDTSGGSIIVDTFADENLNLHYHRRADISGSFIETNFYMIVTDLSNNFIKEGEVYNLKVTSLGMASIRLSTEGYGEEIFVGSSGDYIIPSADGMEFVKVKVFVPDETASLFSGSDLTIDITGYNELPSSVLHLSRCLFSPEYGIVIEDIHARSSSEIGAAGIIDKRTSGTIDDTIVSEALLERYIQGPRNELRSSGFIRGFEITNLTKTSSTSTFDLSSGIAVINGVRFEFPGKAGVTFDHDGGPTDNFYLTVDNEGCLRFGNEVDKAGGTNYISPFSVENNLHIGYFDVTNEIIYDLRFFIDRIDYKMMNEIIVSPEDHFGHFKTIKNAVKYCEVFSNMFKNQKKPKIKLAPGIHEINSKITIDFDLEIEGCGPEAIVQRGSDYLLENGRTLIQIGNQFTQSNFVYGVSLSNFTYNGVDAADATGRFAAMVAVSHNLDIVENSILASFKFSNINFSSPNNGIGNSWNEYIIIGTPTNTSTAGTFQNISLSNCYFNNFGLHNFSVSDDAVLVCTNSLSTYKNIIVSNCIRDWSSLSIAYSPAFINVNGTSTAVEVIEVGNVSIN